MVESSDFFAFKSMEDLISLSQVSFQLDTRTRLDPVSVRHSKHASLDITVSKPDNTYEHNDSSLWSFIM